MATTYTQALATARSGDTVTRAFGRRASQTPTRFLPVLSTTRNMDDGYFNQLSSGIAYNEAYATLTMIFQAEPADEKHEDGDIEYSCNASTFETA